MFAELEIEPAFLLSNERIPPCPHPKYRKANRYQWYGIDNERGYRKNPHPSLGPDDVSYELNADGYRCPDLSSNDLNPDDAVTVACIGASTMMGTGLPQSQSLVACIQEELETRLDRRVAAWNFGSGGGSADYVTRMLFSVLAVQQPDIVVLSTFPFNRREFIGELGTIFSTQAYPHWQQRFVDPERYRMQVICRDLSNPYNHVMHFLTNALVWESLCDRAGTPWVFMTEGSADEIRSINQFMTDSRRMLEPGMTALKLNHASNPDVGLARDMRHPGSKPVRDIATILVDNLGQVYPEQMARLGERSACSSGKVDSR